jgi:hypothetical protein
MDSTLIGVNAVVPPGAGLLLDEEESELASEEAAAENNVASNPGWSYPDSVGCRRANIGTAKLYF